MSTFVVLVLKCYFRACLVIKRINVLIYKQCFFTVGCECFAFAELSAVLLQATYVLIIIIDVFVSVSEWLFRRRFLCHTTQAEYLCNYRLIGMLCHALLQKNFFLNEKQSCKRFYVTVLLSCQGHK